jgi:hypothetical protein
MDSFGNVDARDRRALVRIQRQGWVPGYKHFKDLVRKVDQDVYQQDRPDQ